MNESILKALMQLFAIIANVEEKNVSETARSIVEAFLHQHLNQSQVNEYLLLFDDYIIAFHAHKPEKEKDKIQKRNSAQSVKVLKICEQINKELHQREKVIVLMRLIEFVNEDEIITPEEFDFVSTVADAFKIPRKEFDDLKSFMIRHPYQVSDSSNLLLIDNKDAYAEEGGLWFAENRPQEMDKPKHMYSENLDGQIWVIKIPSIQLFFFYYQGTDNIYLNGHNIMPGGFYILDNGSIIKGPRIKPIYYADIVGYFLESKYHSKVIFTAKNVEFSYKNSHHGIKKFTFSEESGQLIGVMGSSGTGKSTLLNILSGKQCPSGGEVMLNGYNLYTEKSKLEGIIGFVPQDDLLIEELTVFQNLYYNAKLCLSNFSEQQIIKTVHKSLIDLDLYDIKDQQVGTVLNKTISGGQRKRLNIALELMREPSVLFVDEPTSGLSSMDSENVMLLLKQQTLKGRLVIVNIHQPPSDIFKLFDKLWILDKGGYPIYAGNPIDAVIYFKKISNHVNANESECPVCGNVNAEQILQIVESKVVDESGKFSRQRKISPQEWYNLYLENIQSKIEIKDPESKIPKTKFQVPDLDRQFGIYFIRNLLSKLVNRQYLLVTLFEAPLLAIILAYFTKYTMNGVYIFSDNKNLPAYLFMSVVVALFLGLTISAEEIIKDRKLLERESFLNLSRFSYINSKILYLFILSAIQTISYVAIGNAILEIKGMLLPYWFILFSASCMANLMGLNISSGLNSVVTIYILIPFLLVPQLLLSGTIVAFDDLHESLTDKVHVPMIGNLMTSRWAYEAMAVKQFKDNKYEKNFYAVDKKISDVSYNITYKIPRMQSMLDEIKINTTNNTNQQQTRDNLLTLKNELPALWKTAEVLPYGMIKKLNPKNISPDVIEETNDYLQYLIMNLQDKLEKVRDKRNKKVLALKDSLGNKALVKLKQNHHNKRLTDWVLDRQEIIKIIERNHHFIRKKDPVFNYPDSPFGRAHFYAPVKKIRDQYIDTFIFNNSIIWLMTIILYLTLLYDVLRKIIEYIERIKLSKKEL